MELREEGLGAGWGPAERKDSGVGRGEGADIWDEQGRELRGAVWDRRRRGLRGLDGRGMGLGGMEERVSGVGTGGVLASKTGTGGAEGAGSPASALRLLHRSSSPSATFQKSWISASSRRRALARLRSIAQRPIPSPGHNQILVGAGTSSWHSFPIPDMDRDYHRTAAGPDTGPHRRPSSRGFPQRCPSWRSWMATSG